MEQLDQYIERIEYALAEFPKELISARLHDGYGRHCFVGFLSVSAVRQGFVRRPGDLLSEESEFMFVKRIYDAGLESAWHLNDRRGYFETDTARAKRMKRYLRRKLSKLRRLRELQQPE